MQIIGKEEVKGIDGKTLENIINKIIKINFSNLKIEMSVQVQDHK